MSKNNYTGLTEDEIAALESENANPDAAAAAAAEAAKVEAEKNAAAGTDAEKAAAEAAEQQKKDAEAAAAAAAAGGDGAPAEEDTAEGHFVPTMQAPAADKADAERLEAIKTEKSAALKRFSEGEISAEEYSVIEDNLATERAELIAKRQNAEFAQNYNAQMQQNLLSHTRETYLRSARAADGVDYSKPEIAAKFDRAFKLLAADPEHSEKPMSEINSVYEEAHRMVKAQIGWTAPPATDLTKTAPKPGEKPALRVVPKTLATMPAAAPADNNADPVYDELVKLDGEDLERKLASMPRNEVNRLMRKVS